MGLTRFYSPNLRPLLGSIEEQAENLARQLDALKAKAGPGPMKIVAHSMGGLVCRYYLEKLGGQDNVPVLVTLGTPHFGTEKARAGFGPAARQMVPGSDFLRKLNQGKTETRLLSLWSDFDSLVVPPENAALEDSNIALYPYGHLPFVGHNGFLFSKKAARIVYAILAAR